MPKPQLQQAAWAFRVSILPSVALSGLSVLVLEGDRPAR